MQRSELRSDPDTVHERQGRRMSALVRRRDCFRSPTTVQGQVWLNVVSCGSLSNRCGESVFKAIVVLPLIGGAAQITVTYRSGPR